MGMRNTAAAARRAAARRERFMPGGVPRFVRVYDNGGETADRYTVLFTGRYRQGDRRYPAMLPPFVYLGMSESPTSPQGFCQHGESDVQIDTLGANGATRWGGVSVGRTCHLGRRIRFQDLPAPCRRVVVSDYVELHGLELEPEPAPAPAQAADVADAAQVGEVVGRRI